MPKSTLHKLKPATEPKPQAKPQLFFPRIPADRPKLDPNLKLHLEVAADHLKDQIANLDTVENLAAIDEENNTIHAMRYGITAVLQNLKEVHEHFSEAIRLIESTPVGKGGEA